MPPYGRQLRSAPSQLRPSAAGRGTGWPQLVKLANPAAGANLVRVIPGDYWERILSLAATVTMSAGGSTRTVSIQMQDGDGYVFNSTPVNLAVQASSVLNIFADIQSVTQAQPGTGSANTGTVTNPGALTNIVSVPVPGGTFLLKWSVELAGTVTAADANNMRLNGGGGNNLIALTQGAVGVYPQPDLQAFANPGGGTFSVQSIAAASGAAAVYWASLSAIPLAGFANQVQIPDFILKSGWQLALVIGGIQAGDQISGASILAERYPSSDVSELEGDWMDRLAERIAYNLR